MYPLSNYDWAILERKAEEIVKACVSSMPDEIGDLARRVPTLIRHWAPEVENEDSEAVDLLGEYIAYETRDLNEGNGAIALYLGAIQLYCDEEGANFEEELRRTYLHELGHHFGWDEDDLTARDLD